MAAPSPFQVEILNPALIQTDPQEVCRGILLTITATCIVSSVLVTSEPCVGHHPHIGIDLSSVFRGFESQECRGASHQSNVATLCCPPGYEPDSRMAGTGQVQPATTHSLEALLPFDHLILYLFNHHSEFILANLLMTCPAIGSIAWPHIPPDRFQSL